MLEGSVVVVVVVVVVYVLCEAVVSGCVVFRTAVCRL